nr:MAG: hypothetical protein DIU54_03820 [Acidobacteriota bacterium]
MIVHMRPRGLPGLLLLAAVVLFVLPSAVRYYTDWLWFQEVGYTSVFLRTLNAQAVVFLISFTVSYLFLLLNLRAAQSSSTPPRPRIVIGRGGDGRPIALDTNRAVSMAMPVAVIVSGVLALVNAGQWLTWLSYLHATPFGVEDPLFGRDVAYYVFELPVYQIVRRQLLLITVIALIGCALLYVFSGSFVIESTPGLGSWPRLRLIPKARRHLSLLMAFVLALLAWGAWLEIPGTLLSPSDARVAFGASYADVYARIPFLWAAVAVLVAGAGLSIWHGFGRRGWPLPLAIAAYFVVTLAGGLYAGAIQRLVVTPNEQEKERPFIEHNIALTRQAYALERVEERNLSGDAELTAEDIIANAETIENVRLWDHDQLLQTFGQIQVIRTYYDFRNIDNDRYTIDGKYRQVMLSLRELNTQNMPNRSWVNERLVFTHGYGLTLGPVNQVTTEGLPVLFIRDLPPVSTVDLPVTQPSIYYGELSSDYVLVRTRQPEFHYPRGDDNETTYYEGSGGVPVGSLLRRLLFAIRFASTDILVTNQLTSESRILYYRNIVDRVRQIAPFLALDADPYPVVADGRIVWMQDAYTTSRNYPYATRNAMPGPLNGINYIRNSVKITIDAFDGTVRFYLAEPDDPIAQTLSHIFPGVLRPLDEMPAALRSHIRYPEDIFLIQAEKYATYHMTNPQVFYNNEDEWRRPVLESGSGQNQRSSLMSPYYTIMKLPGSSRAEFIQMLPFTPRARDNLAAWMVARSDGENYGRLLVFQFPKQKIIYGPAQIVARINQDPVISPQITLWSQQGVQVIQGTLLVIPIQESLLYVRPLYLRSQQGRIPELKQVIVAYQNRIVMAETLVAALGRIFGPAVTQALAPDQLSASATSVVETRPPSEDELEVLEAPEGLDLPRLPPAPPPVPPSLRELAAEAQRHLEAAQAAQRAGDWAAYGEALKRLEDAIARMQNVEP